MGSIFFTPLEEDEDEDEEEGEEEDTITTETWGAIRSSGMVGLLKEYWLRSLLFGLVAADDTSADDDDDDDDDGRLLSLILIVKESKL